MSNRSTTAGAHRAQTLLATLLEALGTTIAMARANGSADGASAALALILEQWRTQLVASSPAAVAPAQLVIALTAIFALSEVRLVDTTPQPGIHIDGPASATFDAALRLVYVTDQLYGSTVGEETMVALLGGFMTAASDPTPPGDRLH